MGLGCRRKSWFIGGQGVAGEVLFNGAWWGFRKVLMTSDRCTAFPGAAFSSL